MAMPDNGPERDGEGGKPDGGFAAGFAVPTEPLETEPLELTPLELDPLETGSPGTERLALDDDDISLPWLESDDDPKSDEGPDAGRVMGLMLLGLVALGVIVGGIWWGTRRAPDTVLVADGGTIAAPDRPYKEAPRNPGGKTFEGTGDSSFAVSEGQSRPARLGQGPAPKPRAAPSARAAAAATATATAGGVGVQVAAYSNQASAEAGWTRLSQQYEALSGLKHRVVEGRADIGTVYRLQALAPDSGAAHALCGRLKSAGLACQVKN